MTEQRSGVLLRALAALTWAQLKFLLRDFGALFWSFLFPVVMVLIFGETFGNKPRPELGGFGYIDAFVPGLMAIAVSSTAFYQSGAAFVELRERQVLRRLRVTPMPPWSLIVSQILPSYIVILATCLAVWATGAVLYGVRMQGSAPAVFGAITLSAVSFIALAFMMSALVRSAGAGNAIAGGVNMLMMVLSGAIVPVTLMSDQIQKVAKLIPLTYAVNLLRVSFNGMDPSSGITAILVLAGCLAGGILVSSLAFRWE